MLKAISGWTMLTMRLAKSRIKSGIRISRVQIWWLRQVTSKTALIASPISPTAKVRISFHPTRKPMMRVARLHLSQVLMVVLHIPMTILINSLEQIMIFKTMRVIAMTAMVIALMMAMSRV